LENRNPARAAGERPAALYKACPALPSAGGAGFLGLVVSRSWPADGGVRVLYRQILSFHTVRRSFDLALMLPFPVGGILGVPARVLGCAYLDPLLFKAAVGALLSLYCPVDVFSRELPRSPPRRQARPMGDRAVGTRCASAELAAGGDPRQFAENSITGQ